MKTLITRRFCRRASAFTIASAAAAGLLLDCPAKAGTTTIALTGQALPDGNGAFGNFGAPQLNASGQLAFVGANFTGTSGGALDNSGIYFYNGTSLQMRVRENAAAPEGNGLFSFIAEPVLNNSGQIAFLADLRNTSGGTLDDRAIYFHNGTSLVNRARENGAVPEGNGLFNALNGPLLNNFGQIAFSSTLRNTSGGTLDDSGIYVHNGTSLTNRVRENSAAPEGNGLFSGFGGPAGLNASGQVSFGGVLRNTSGGTIDDSGNYVHTVSAVVNRTRENTAPPEGNGLFSDTGFPLLNGVGMVAFKNDLRNTSGGTLNDSGMYLHNGSARVNIAREGNPVPEGNGTFSHFFDNPVINGSGQVAFRVSVTNTSGGTFDDGGVYLHNGTSLKRIARKGDTLPEGSGFYSGFTNPELNNTGQVAFYGLTNGGPTGTSGRIFLGDELEVINVVRESQSLAGKTVNVAQLLGFGSPENGAGTALNDSGQVAYQVTFTDGTSGVFLFTPDLRWRSSTSGGWDDSINWTVGLRPRNVHDVKIDPAASLTVSGPASAVSVKSLQVGGGTGIATLDLQLGGSITTSSAVVVQPTGVLTGDGSIIASVTNNGTVVADNLTITGTLTNNGIISGDGRVNTVLSNGAAGEVRIGSGQTIHFTGASNSSSGRVEVIGGEVEFDNALTNSATGVIFGRAATMRFNGGVTNNGDVAFSFGTSDVFGNVTNNSGGQVLLSGNSNTTFYDAVTVSAGSEFRVSTGSTAVFFGFVSGTGNFTGGGTKFFEGGSSASIGNLASGGITIVGGGSSLVANHIRESSLIVEGDASIRPNGTPAGTSRVNTLAIPAGGTLDLTDNDLIVTTTPLSSIRSLIVQARNGGAWDQPGLTSSAAHDRGVTTLGVLSGAEYSTAGGNGTFSGQPYAPTDTLVKYTWYGDTDFNGVVNGADYARIDAAFNNQVTQGNIGGWFNGDLDYNGKVDGADYALMDAAFNSQSATLRPGAAVPEPTMLSVFGGLAASAARLRTRRRR